MEISMGLVIRNKRLEVGITQEVLAGILGVTKAAVSKWESNQSFPDVTLIPQIASYFSISIDELFGYERPKVTNTRKVLYSGIVIKENFIDVSFLDGVKIKSCALRKQSYKNGTFVYETWIDMQTYDRNVIAKMQEALVPGKYQELLEADEEAGKTFHCYICKEKVLRHETSNMAQIKEVFGQLISWGYLEDADF